MMEPEGKCSKTIGASLKALWKSATEGCLVYRASVKRQRSVIFRALTISPFSCKKGIAASLVYAACANIRHSNRRLAARYKKNKL